MTPDKINNKGQARIFENDFLEMLTKDTPIVHLGNVSTGDLLLPVYSGSPLSLQHGVYHAYLF